MLKDIDTLFGVGKKGKAPGTLATAIALPVFYFLRKIFGMYYYAFFFIMFLPYAIKECQESYAEKGDHSSIVLDEVIGIGVFFMFIKLGLLRALVGFISFRLFDIFKPWPISIWQKDKSQISIVADDILAGLMAVFVSSIF